MIKRLILSLALAFGLIAPSHGAGTIPFSLSQQFDSLGHVLAGCKFYTIQAGTTSTPQSAYQDSALTIDLPNPQTCDAAGRLPQMFLADGTIKVRLTDRNGVTQVIADNIQVIGASTGGGGGGTVDPTTILATGDIKVAYGTGILSGFVRANGRTIGSATSGATERANADTNALFIYLWGADANLAVSGGRGASAAADWAANKTIDVPDWRGRALAGLDDMGNATAGRLTATYFGTSPTVLGAASTFLESRTLLTTNLPAYTPSFSSAPTLTLTMNLNSVATTGSDTPTGLSMANTGGTNIGQQSAFIGTKSIAYTFAAQGGTSAPVSVIQPTMLATIYLKL